MMQCKVSCWLNTHSTQTWLNTVYVHTIDMCIYIYSYILYIAYVQSNPVYSNHSYLGHFSIFFSILFAAPLGPSAFRWRQRLRQPLRAHREHRGECAGDRGGHAAFWENVKVVECVWLDILILILLYYIIPWNIYIYTYYFILKFDLDFLQLTLQNVNMILLTVASLGWICKERAIRLIVLTTPSHRDREVIQYSAGESYHHLMNNQKPKLNHRIDLRIRESGETNVPCQGHESQWQ